MEIAAFDEFTALTSGELATLGITNQRLVVNGVFTARDREKGKVDVYRISLTALADGDATTVVLVTRAEGPALAEAARSVDRSDISLSGHGCPLVRTS